MKKSWRSRLRLCVWFVATESGVNLYVPSRRRIWFSIGNSFVTELLTGQDRAAVVFVGSYCSRYANIICSCCPPCIRYQITIYSYDLQDYGDKSDRSNSDCNQIQFSRQLATLRPAYYRACVLRPMGVGEFILLLKTEWDRCWISKQVESSIRIDWKLNSQVK